MKQRPLLPIVVVLATFVVFGSLFVYGQGTDLGTIRGTVTDRSGALVVNATVTILDLATNTPRTTTTNSHGEFQMFGLRSGSYKVSITAPGMGTSEVTGIRLNGSDTVSANVMLKVASSQQAVEVTAQAPLIDSDDQPISTTLGSQAI